MSFFVEKSSSLTNRVQNFETKLSIDLPMSKKYR